MMPRYLILTIFTIKPDKTLFTEVILTFGITFVIRICIRISIQYFIMEPLSY